MLGGQAVTTVHAVGVALVRGICRAPVATGAVAVVWALRAASGVVSIDLDAPVESMGADAGGWVGDGIAFAVSPFWTPGVAGLWAATAALLTLGVVAERRLGWRRFAAAAGVSLLAGPVTALVLAAVAGRTGQLLAEAASSVVADGGPLLCVVGAFMACTATMATLWRQSGWRCWPSWPRSCCSTAARARCCCWCQRLPGCCSVAGGVRSRSRRTPSARSRRPEP